MLNKLKKTNTDGFTIIEVMIVLAIAALILLIVLLAVPALQRNSRNTQLKNDASTISAGVNEFKSNNDGVAPTTVTATSITGGAGTAPVAIKLSSGTTPTPTNTPGQGKIGYAAGACPGSTANPRSFAIYYTAESSTAVVKCIDS